jgi:hypothetical protein
MFSFDLFWLQLYKQLSVDEMNIKRKKRLIIKSGCIKE